MHLLPGRAAATSQYRQAGADDGRLMAIAQEMTSGGTFNAREEAEAKARGWR